MARRLREPDVPAHVIEITKRLFPCTCGDIYLSRKLTAPDCPYHAYAWEEFAEEILKHPTPTVSAEGVLTHERLMELSESHVEEVKAAARVLGGELNAPAAAGHRSGYFKGYKDGYAASQFRTPAPEGELEKIFTKEPVNFLLSNALRYLDADKLKTLTESLAERCGLKVTTPAPADSVAAPVEVEELANLKTLRNDIQWMWDNMGTEHTADHFNIPANAIRYLDAFISNYSHTPDKGEGKEEWVRVEDAPLFTIDANGNWECTEAGNGEFWAAVPYIDKKQTDRKDLVWIQRCIVEDGTVLCIVGDEENTMAGYELSDVVYYIPINLPPLPTPPKQ